MAEEESTTKTPKNDTPKSKKRCGPISKKLYQHFCDYIRYRVVPSKAELLRAGLKPTKETYDRQHVQEVDNSTPKTRVKPCFLKIRFKNWASKMKIVDDNLVHKSSEKIIVPFEDFPAVVHRIHSSNYSHGAQHRSVTETIYKLKESYAIGRRQYGINESTIRRIVESCPNLQCSGHRGRGLRKEPLVKNDDSSPEVEIINVDGEPKFVTRPESPIEDSPKLMSPKGKITKEKGKITLSPKEHVVQVGIHPGPPVKISPSKPIKLLPAETDQKKNQESFPTYYKTLGNTEASIEGATTSEQDQDENRNGEYQISKKSVDTATTETPALQNQFDLTNFLNAVGKIKDNGSNFMTPVSGNNTQASSSHVMCAYQITPGATAGEQQLKLTVLPIVDTSNILSNVATSLPPLQGLSQPIPFLLVQNTTSEAKKKKDDLIKMITSSPKKKSSSSFLSWGTRGSQFPPDRSPEERESSGQEGGAVSWEYELVIDTIKSMQQDVRRAYTGDRVILDSLKKKINYAIDKVRDCRQELSIIQTITED